MLFRLLALLSVLMAPPHARNNEGVSVEVTRDDRGWSSEYQFDRDAGAWLFLQSTVNFSSGKPWRTDSWSVDTPGVRLVRAGAWDVLVADQGPVPRRVRIRFRPYGEPLRADYSPALLFSNGEAALYTDQFAVAPIASRAAAEALPTDIDAAPLARPQVRLRLRNLRGTVLIEGRATRSEALTTASAGTYAYFGTIPVVQNSSFAGILDPGLPRWIANDLRTFLPRLLAFYSARLGAISPTRPSAYLTWKGATPGREGLGGSTLPGLVVLDFEGANLVHPSERAQQRIRWFFAHETAHFWLGQAARNKRRDQAWLHEGGADALSIRALRALLGTGYDPLPAVQRRLDDCIAAAPNGGLLGATARGEQLANYNCGAILSLVAEAAIRKRDPRADILSFWRALIVRARQGDNSFDQAMWLDELTRQSGDEGLADMIAEFARAGSRDPQGFFAGLFTRAAIPFARSESGKLVLSAI